MPSPFPGMDPFIECGPWSDFHAAAISEMRRVLNHLLPDGYAARVEQRVYVDDDPPETRVRDVAPDAVVFDAPEASRGTRVEGATATVSQTVVWPMPVEHRETWLEVRDLRQSHIITLIELLSPSNKRPGSKGQRLYLRKRRRVLESRSHFVEIDLLRGEGTVWPALPEPPGDFYVAVSRAESRPNVQLYSWSLRDPMPSISIPLKRRTPDVVLNLQEVLNAVYDDGRYGKALYEVPLNPPLSAADNLWVRPIVDHLLKA
jgi:hypothetical protein